MKKILGLCACLLLSVQAVVWADSTPSSEQITVAGTAIGFTSGKITPSGSVRMTRAVCRLETAEIRYTIDGTTPSATNGALLEVGEVLTLTGRSFVTGFRGIRTGSSGKLNCVYDTPDSEVSVPSVVVQTVGSATASTSGEYNATPPTIADTGTDSLQMDSHGSMKVRAAAADGTPIADDSAVDAARGTNPPVPVGGSFETTPTAVENGDKAELHFDANQQLITRQLDPCSGLAKTYAPISIGSAATTEVVGTATGAGNYVYVCSINLVTAAANNVALVWDDTDACASPGTGGGGMAGGTDAATGWNFGANGGLTLGNGNGTVMKSGANAYVCLITSAATQLSGTVAYVIAP